MNKKIFSLCIVILFMFGNFTYVHAASDTTPPVITGMTWSSSELQVGDKLDIQISASDAESGIHFGDVDTSIYIKNSISEVYKCAQLAYDDVTNKLKASFSITSDMQSGEWILYFITLKDNAGNKKFFHASDFSKEYKINILGGIKDTTPPVITEMTWSASKLQVGDKLDIEIAASDAESGIHCGDVDTGIYIENSVSGIYRWADLAYDGVTNKLKASFSITSDMQSGEWILYFISLKDNAGNQRFFHASDFSQEYKVNVISNISDTTPPVIKSMTWSASELQAGDKLEVLIDAVDAESGIHFEDVDTSIYIEDKNTGIYKCQILSFDDTTNMLKATFTITPDMSAEQWSLYFISLKDNTGNKIFYHPSDLSQEYTLNIKSVFQGTENKPILKGSQFNPLQGVTARSTFEGDFTSNLKYSSSVNSDIEGIYLVKYEATGKSGNVYTDYRWISVVDNLSYDESGNLQQPYFNKDINISMSNIIDSNSINITKDGSNYGLSSDGVISEEGNYKLSFRNSAPQNSFQPYLLKPSSPSLKESQAYIQPGDLEFTIDKTVPNILQCIPQTTKEGTFISADKFVKATDNSSLTYKYVTEPEWNKIGNQNIGIMVTDSAGNYTTKTVKLTVLDKCDIDRDGSVSVLDLAAAAKNYNSKENSALWNSSFDFNKDGIIDIYDLVISSKRIK